MQHFTKLNQFGVLVSYKIRLLLRDFRCTHLRDQALSLSDLSNLVLQIPMEIPEKILKEILQEIPKEIPKEIPTEIPEGITNEIP